MTKKELLSLRSLISKYTDYLLDKIQSEKMPDIDKEISKLELINFIDRGNRVAFNLEKLLDD
jgi:hypothetical protein